MRWVVLAALLTLLGASPPRALRGTFEVVDIGVASHSEATQQYDAFHFAVIRAFFDQPLFVNGSVPITAATAADLRGVARVHCRGPCDCGNDTISHVSPCLRVRTNHRGAATNCHRVPVLCPRSDRAFDMGALSPRAWQAGGGLFDARRPFLLPLHSPDVHAAAPITSVLRSTPEDGAPNEFAAAMLLGRSQDEREPHRRALGVQELKHCRIAFSTGRAHADAATLAGGWLSNARGTWTLPSRIAHTNSRPAHTTQTLEQRCMDSLLSAAINCCVALTQSGGLSTQGSW